MPTMPAPPPGSPTPKRTDNPNAPRTPWKTQVLQGLLIIAIMVYLVLAAPGLVKLLTR